MPYPSPRILSRLATAVCAVGFVAGSPRAQAALPSTPAPAAGPAAGEPTPPPAGDDAATKVDTVRAKEKAYHAEIVFEARVAVAAGHATREQQAIFDAEQAAVGVHVAAEALSWIGVPKYVTSGDDLTEGIDPATFIARVYERAGVSKPVPPAADGTPAPDGPPPVPSGPIVHWRAGVTPMINGKTISLPTPPAITALCPGDLLTMDPDAAAADKTVPEHVIYVGRSGNIDHAFVSVSRPAGTVAVQDLDTPANWPRYRYAIRPGAVTRDAVYAGSAAVAEQWGTGGSICVLSVGVAGYRDDAIKLSSPAADAGNFVDSLANVFGSRVDVKKSVTLPDKSIKSEILSSLADVGYRTTPSDVFVLYFEGQGTSSGLLAADYQMVGGTGSNGIISWDELVDKLLLVPANRIVLTLDTSFVSPPPAAWSRLAKSGKQILLWAASGEVQKSYETSFGADGKHGIFTYYLMRGLKDAVDRGSGLSINDLTSYVTSHVREDTADLQVPHFLSLSVDTASPLLPPKNADRN